MSPATAQGVAERAAHLATAGLPLAAGLRAAAKETDLRPLRRALVSIAVQLERGRSRADCLRSGRRARPHLVGLMAAAPRSGGRSRRTAEAAGALRCGE